MFLGNGDYVEFTVKAIGGQPLKITLCWTDPPGTVPTADVDVNVAALVNDLDLRVTQGANTYYPWKLNPASPGTAATRNGDNDRDNVEQVLVDNPVAGAIYTIRVTHKGTLKDDTGATAGQTLSLILSGNQAETPPAFKVTSFTKTATNEFTVVWPTVVGGVYQLQTTTDLINWSDDTGEISATKMNASLPRIQNGTDTRRFYRVKRLR